MPQNVFSNLLGPEAFAPFFALREQVWTLLERLAPYSTIVALLFLVGIVYCFLRIEKIVHETKHEDKVHDERHARGTEGVENPTEKRWQRVVDHVTSERESDWRLAVLEADVLLDEMVTHLGYHGDSLGEKLKSIEKSDFTTLDKAWEAHAVRNNIAHQGGTFVLTEREAKRIVELYEEVFREFRFI